MKKIDKILNVILGLAFIVIIAGGWVFSAIAYNKINKFEKQYQADMEELEEDLDAFYFEIYNDFADLVDGDIDELRRRVMDIYGALGAFENAIDDYDYIPSLVERIEELEDMANAFDDLEDALEKALNEINARLDALEGLK